MPDSWTIRRGTPADADAISRLLVELTTRSIAPDCSAAGTAHLLDAMSPTMELQHLRGDCIYYVAEHAGRVVGVSAIRPPAHLYRLFVSEDMQNKGLARALWDAAREAFFRMHGAGPVTVNSARRAVAAYQKLDFIVQGPEQVLNGVPTTPMLWTPAVVPLVRCR